MILSHPARGANMARFTIISKTPFQKGSDATLMQSGGELQINVERVTLMPHKGINIVSFLGLFDGMNPARPTTLEPAGTAA